MKLKKIWPIILLALIGSFVGFFLAKDILFKDSELLSSFKAPLQKQEKKLPLLVYSISNLAKQEFSATAPLSIIESKTGLEPGQSLFSFETDNASISGIINYNPEKINQTYPVIIMLRGWVPTEGYYPGMGTKNAAQIFANNGYLTIAPDFLGYGSSSKELEDSWANRFIKPKQIADLITTIKEYPQIETADGTLNLNPNLIGIWAHSNGGQIALNLLEILPTGLPTTLWAPVTAPFPYSILFFSDEYSDEGKETRHWLSMFERDYDVFDFSYTKHLELLKGPIQIHHGTSDEAALIAWTDELMEKIDLENERRVASSEAELEIEYYRYPGANHNLQPSWNTAIERDLNFFAKHLQ